ncbi:MAG: acyl-CoA dehydrogenase [Candidatus Dadabacteria bacterium]|nr:MAG: acyl-CoA dehydrogenase [Candidatus Dadabacteria bacterium]
MAQPKDFGFGDEERMVRDGARRLLAERAGVESLRRLVARDYREAYQAEVPPAAYDEDLWRTMVELGWTALAVPEQAGGVGMNMAAVAALAEEAGRAALPSPLIATLLATVVLREAPLERARPWLERIVAGSPATLAITPQDGSWDPAATDVEAEGNRLRGTAWFVQDARKAEFFVVSARSADGVGLYAVEAGAPGVRIHPDRIVDLTRDQARVEFDEVEVGDPAVVAPGGAGGEALARAWPAMLTIVAADMCGAAEWQLQTTAEYARVRKQFDRPIGFFQAVKHPIVNMMLEIDGARSLVYNAACAIDHEPERAELYARMAKAAASDAAAFCSGRSVQLHGGIGVTWECDVHIYFKRQLHNQQFLGDGIYQRERIAEVL